MISCVSLCWDFLILSILSIILSIFNINLILTHLILLKLTKLSIMLILHNNYT